MTKFDFDFCLPVRKIEKLISSPYERMRTPEHLFELSFKLGHYNREYYNILCQMYYHVDYQKRILRVMYDYKGKELGTHATYIVDDYPTDDVGELVYFCIAAVKKEWKTLPKTNFWIVLNNEKEKAYYQFVLRKLNKILKELQPV